MPVRDSFSIQFTSFLLASVELSLFAGSSMVSGAVFTAPVEAQTVDAAYSMAVSRTWSIEAEVNKVFLYSPEYVFWLHRTLMARGWAGIFRHWSCPCQGY